MRLLSTLVALCLVIPLSALAQVPDRDYYYVDKSYYSRLVIPKKMVLVVESHSLVVDTLIMDDRSTMKFQMQQTTLTVRNAFIARKCRWDAAGGDEAGTAGRGKNGRNLYLNVTFHTLGDLTVDTRGGTGGRGYDGRRGTDGRDGSVSAADGGPGQEGGRGGTGGDGGNLTLYYLCTGFIPSFNTKGKHAIYLMELGGHGGGGGRGGPGGRGGKPITTRYEYPQPTTEVNGILGANGQTGTSGHAGENGKDGILVCEKIHR